MAHTPMGWTPTEAREAAEARYLAERGEITHAATLADALHTYQELDDLGDAVMTLLADAESLGILSGEESEMALANFEANEWDAKTVRRVVEQAAADKGIS